VREGIAGEDPSDFFGYAEVMWRTCQDAICIMFSNGGRALWLFKPFPPYCVMYDNCSRSFESHVDLDKFVIAYLKGEK